MVIRKYLGLTAILFYGLLLPETGLAAVSASLNRAKIEINETVQLVIKSDNINLRSNPDLSVLGQNFTVLSTSTSQNISIVNGAQTAEKTWVSEIEPKSPGSFTIPPIVVGNEQTQTLRLTVLPESSPDPDNPKDIFVEFKTDGSLPYVQQQVIATVKLYLGVNLIDGSLTDPEAKDVNVVRIGKDTQYTEQVSGRPYRVIERTYALFPGASGEVRIDPIRFQGLAEDSSSNSRTYNSIFNRGTRVTARSQSLTLQVKPPAPEFSGRIWLPAKNLQLEDLSSDLTDVEPGQPVNLQIRLKAKGLSAEQLPDIALPESDSFKQYSDKPVRRNEPHNQDITSTLTQSIAVIAGKSGLLRIPEIKLNWWNTETDRMETSSLPAREITIKSLTANGDQEISSQPIATQSQPSENNTETTTQNNHTPDRYSQDHRWIWVSLLLLTGWIITIWFLIREIRKHRPGRPDATESKLTHNLAQIQNQIQLACKNNDLEKSRQLILDWAKQLWQVSSIQGLDDVANKIPAENLSMAIKELDSALYSTHNEEKSSWSGNKLSKALNEYISSSPKTNKNKTSALPELYPTQAATT